MKLEYHGKVNADGKIELPKRLRKEVGEAYAGKPITVVFKRKKKQRTSEQNRYYWGVVIPWIIKGLRDLGHNVLDQPDDREAIHQWLKSKFLRNGKVVTDAHGQEIRLHPTTTILSTIEQEDYHSEIRQWASEFLNVAIPLPNEQLEMFGI